MSYYVVGCVQSTSMFETMRHIGVRAHMWHTYPKPMGHWQHNIQISWGEMNMQTWVSKFKMAAHVWSCVECVMSHVMADQEKIKVRACLVFFWHYVVESHDKLLKNTKQGMERVFMHDRKGFWEFKKDLTTQCRCTKPSLWYSGGEDWTAFPLFSTQKKLLHRLLWIFFQSCFCHF